MQKLNFTILALFYIFLVQLTDVKCQEVLHSCNYKSDRTIVECTNIDEAVQLAILIEEKE